MATSQIEKIKAAFPNATITELKPKTWIVEGDGLYLSVTELQIRTSKVTTTDTWGKDWTARP